MKRSALIFTVLLFTGILTAQTTLAILPFTGRDGKSRSYSSELTENLKMMISNIQGVSASYFSDSLDRRIAGRLKRCGTDLRCVGRYAAKMKRADYLMLPLIARGRATVVKFYIYDTSGKTVAKDIIKENGRIDAVDLIAPVIEKINSLAGGLSAPASGGAPEPQMKTDSDISSDRPVQRVSGREKKRKYREGFRHYKKGNVEKAITAYKQAGKDKVAKAVAYIHKKVNAAKQALNNREYDHALDLLTRAENNDVVIRKYGYKELQFIKETHKRHLYQKGTDRQYQKVDRIFSRIKKDIRELGTWKQDTVAKLRSKMESKMNLQAKINRDFEQKSRALDDKHAKIKSDVKKQIKDYKRQLANLDTKYKGKIHTNDQKVEKLNRELDDNRSFEEKYHRNIEHDIRSLEKSIEKKKKDLVRQKRKGNKKRERAIRTYEKKMENTLKDMQKTSKKLEITIKRKSRAIDKARESVDRRLVKAREKFEKTLEKKRKTDRKDIKAAERKFRKKEKELNKKLNEYSKKIEKASKAVEKVDQEVSGDIRKLEKKLEIAIRRADMKREKTLEKFDKKIRETRQKAEKEYEKKIRETQKGLDAVDNKVMKYESSHTNYSRHRKYRALIKQRKRAQRKLAAIEDNYDRFMKKKLGPVQKKKQIRIAAVGKQSKIEQAKLRKQIARLRANADRKRKVAQAKVRKLEKYQPRFEKKIRAQIRAAEKRMNAEVKKIESREAQRRKAFDVKLKKQRAKYEGLIKKKEAELRKTEKQLAAHGRKIEKVRSAMTAKLDKLRVDLDKFTAGMEKRNQKRFDAFNTQFEKGRQAIMRKYEKKAVARRAQIKKEIGTLEKQMKGFLAARRKEEKTLQQKIVAAEKKLVSLQTAWDKQAEARQRKRQAKLQWAEKEQKKAKARFERAKAGINASYQKKFDRIIAKHLPSLKSASSREYKVDRDRSFEYSALTKDILNTKAAVYATKGDEYLSSNDLDGAQNMFFKAIYTYKDSPAAKKGLARYTAKITSMYKKANNAFDSGDAMMAEDILKKIIRTVRPTNEYYLKAKALMLVIKSL